MSRLFVSTFVWRRACSRLLSIAALTLVTASGSGCTTPAPRAALSQRQRPYVLLVSLDAFRHDYLDRYQIPVLQRIASAGIRAEALVPPFPSKTFPSHYTIVTGLYPGHHGIVGNTFYDRARDRWFRVKDTAAVRDRRWYGGEPIWVAAEREGVKSAVYFWPGSEAEVQGVRPTYLERYDAKVSDTQRVDQTVAWLRRPPAERPHLVLLYLSDVDDTTHRFGPETPHTEAAVASVQRALARLADSVGSMPLRDSLDVVVVSDHGMAEVPSSHTIPIVPLLAAAGVDTSRVRFGDNGPVMSIWLSGDDALARRALDALEHSLTHAHAYARGATPARWHLDGNPRSGDIVVVADLGYVLVKGATDRFADVGTHGWDPSYQEMQGIFVATGPQIRRAGRIPAFESVHVFPFLAAMLGLEHVPRTDADPRVLAPYLRSSPND